MLGSVLIIKNYGYKKAFQIKNQTNLKISPGQVAQLFKSHLALKLFKLFGPVHQKVVNSIPGQSTNLLCRFDSCLGQVQEITNCCFSYQCFSLSKINKHIPG